MRKFISLISFVLLGLKGISQDCTTLGQNPGTAFPVCGTGKFIQNEVPLCGNRDVPVPCPGNIYKDVNPFWYKFTAFTGGTLGFIITPNNLSSDYDWQLFDITNTKPEDVYTNSSLFVACNWSGETGITGTTAGSTSVNVCGGTGQPIFSKMPTLVQGHQYLLLVSHFTPSQSGYTLEFKGGTASITDPTPPALLKAETDCIGQRIKINLNKKMKCSSLALDGSDFTISDPSVNIVKASSVQCTSGFDMDYIELDLDKPLNEGTYELQVKKGSDGNSILDNCENFIPESQKIGFRVAPKQPTLLDSIIPVTCAPSFIDLVFPKGVSCASVAPNGSDFILSGPSSITITKSSVTCENEFTKIIRLEFDRPIVTGGTYTVEVKTGTDGNTLLDECGLFTPVGSATSFSLKDTVSADFTYTVNTGCVADTVTFFHSGKNGINQYNWRINNTRNFSTRNIQQVFSQSGEQEIFLKVSNGFCSDSTSLKVIVPEKLNANFAGPDVICPAEIANFTDLSEGPVRTWNWNFGNGVISASQIPGEQQYTAPSREQEIPVSLVVGDGAGCSDTISKKLLLVTSCVIAVPSAFTPNNDGKNDQLFPSNAYKADNLVFRVFNRYGQVVFETRDWTKRWDGNFKGKAADAGTYVWSLQYVLRSNFRKYVLKGTTVLIR